MISDPALVLVDMQKDYSKPGFALDAVDGVGHMQRALDAAGAFLERYRASGRSPLLVRTHHDESTNSTPWTGMYESRPYARLCHPGTEGAEFVPELDVRGSDVVVTKHRYSAFYNTALDTYLSANDVSHLLVGGVAADVCVESTVRDAFSRDYEVTVLADCTTPSHPSHREHTLERLDTYFGNVRQSSEVDL